jgi:REP element-mobilizing transposase RayT
MCCNAPAKPQSPNTPSSAPNTIIYYESSKSAEITGFLDSCPNSYGFSEGIFAKWWIWSRSYDVGTAGEVRSEVIKMYIKRIEHD